MIDKKLLALLVCPACQGEVQVKNNKIVCIQCLRSYPIVDGIPVLLVDQAEH
ncbi:MAG: Trm112 family protein [Candidatus Omnitrophica bacterium]|nr:Trm112 family protein [Candidatus Omnitrophota bacterium]